MIWPTNPPIHPPTHETKHPPMGGGVFTNFKSSNGIEISQFVQVLLLGGWVDGGRGGWGHPPCMHTHMHTHVHMYDITGNSQLSPYGGSHLHEIVMFMTNACACACMRMCMGVAPTHPHPHPPTHLTPQGGGVTPKTVKFQYILN